MPCKALILDIDGTLIVPGAPCASPAVVKAVKAVQKRGIPVILATGRTSFAATPTILGGIRPDYGVYTNGALILDGAGKVQVASTGGRSCLVVQVDTSAQTAVIKL